MTASFARWLLDSGFDSMLVWVLANNPCRRFYERLGGKLVDEREIKIGEQKLDEVAYGWADVTLLAEDRDTAKEYAP